MLTVGKKNPGVAITTVDKVDFRTKINSDKEGHKL